MPSDTPHNRRTAFTPNSVAQDFLYALRTLRAAPAYAIAVVATLAIGIGATTTIFSVVDGALLKPLPFSQPERVVALYQNDRRKGADHDDVAPANFVDWRARTTSFAAMASAEPRALDFIGSDGVEQVFDWVVTKDFFTVLDARPSLGRLFVADDFTPGPPRVLVLTHASWQRRFGGDRSIVGRQLRIGSGTATVVGVLAPNFDYLASSKMEIYAPTVPDTNMVRIRNVAWHHVVARLKPEVSLGAARADLARVATQLSSEYPATNTDVGVTVERMDRAIVGDAARALEVLFGAVGMVLLIACANVANLVLARTGRRTRELAVRAALGASRSRIVRQLLTENLVTAALDGACGLALAIVGVRIVRALGGTSVPRLADVHVDGRALAFTMAIVVLTTLMFGLMPALRAARLDAPSELRSGGRSGSGVGRARMRRSLVAIEVALAIVLLTGSGLLMRSFLSVVRADRGYRSDHVLAATVFVYKWNPTPRSRVNFVAQLVDRAARLPGVTGAGAISSLPLDLAIGADKGSFTIDGRPTAVGQEPSVHMTAATPGTLRTLGIALHRGRVFQAADDSAGAPVVVINEAMARRFWPGQDPIGQLLRFAFSGVSAQRRIVGIVADSRQTSLDAPGEPIVYVPHAQAPTGAMVIVLRTAVEPRSLLGEFKRAVAELNPALPLANVETLDELVSASIAARRFTLFLFASFAGCALGLALIGVYAVISQGVSERRRELGVRVALGAEPNEIVRMVVGQGLRPALLGLVVGMTAAAGMTALLRSSLIGVQPIDAPTFLGVAGLVLVSATVACLVPARGATRVDPLEALRAE